MSSIDPLILHGLRFGGLLCINEQALVDRYNLALVAFGLKPVAQKPLYIDMCGFSLEVANTLKDIHYLDPDQISPRFIIVSAKQEHAPLVNSSFSSTKKIIQAFFEFNRSAIESITLRDALYGDIQNATMRANAIEDIIDFPYVNFEVHGVAGLIQKSKELAGKIKEFKTDEDSWSDIGMMQEIVTLSKECGDIRKNPNQINSRRFEHPETFSTKLFGGATIIDGIAIGNKDLLKKASNGNTTILDVDVCSQIIKWLEANLKLEKLDLEWLIESGFIDHRLEMIAADLLAGKVDNLDPLIDKKYPEAIMQNNIEILSKCKTFKDIEKLRSLIINKGIKDADTYFWNMPAKSQVILRRAQPEQDFTNDVNRVLGYFSKKDYLTSFILDKPAFYEMFRTLDPVRQDFAAKLIQTRYMIPGENSRQHRNSVKKQFFGKIGDTNV